MNSSLTIQVRFLSAVSIVLLLLAVINLPYGYYQLLRLVVSTNGILLVYKFNQLKRHGLIILFTLIALLFNPIAPVYLDKEIWILIDLMVSGLFFYSLKILQKENV